MTSLHNRVRPGFADAQAVERILQEAIALQALMHVRRRRRAHYHRIIYGARRWMLYNIEHRFFEFTKACREVQCNVKRQL